ncbi:hypothetical protein DYBT9275_02762 [Dyadobacter sp. CECT 9275]|uniref:Uncharacterized protein n=1 Tax=Dyadobacter helix TaxID=2822344 RepID=A0A916JBY3_9BACT|nr:hypothetical protein [Dyadobacter sp. CECT 9275]CAG5001892.1 hypothetical protein DYBT9275_02762 [Dyadobacter sp. CECT 9275]
MEEQDKLESPDPHSCYSPEIFWKLFRGGAYRSECSNFAKIYPALSAEDIEILLSVRANLHETIKVEHEFITEDGFNYSLVRFIKRSASFPSRKFVWGDWNPTQSDFINEKIIEALDSII